MRKRRRRGIPCRPWPAPGSCPIHNRCIQPARTWFPAHPHTPASWTSGNVSISVVRILLITSSVFSMHVLGVFLDRQTCSSLSLHTMGLKQGMSMQCVLGSSMSCEDVGLAEVGLGVWVGWGWGCGCPLDTSCLSSVLRLRLGSSRSTSKSILKYEHFFLPSFTHFQTQILRCDAKICRVYFDCRQKRLYRHQRPDFNFKEDKGI